MEQGRSFLIMTEKAKVKYMKLSPDENKECLLIDLVDTNDLVVEQLACDIPDFNQGDTLTVTFNHTKETE